MRLTYKEYIDAVPRDVAKYVDDLLVYVQYYIVKNNNVENKNCDYTSNNNIKLMVSSLLAGSHINEIKGILLSGGFDSRNIKYQPNKFELSNDRKEELFQIAAPILFPYEELCKYSTINVYDIINNTLRLNAYSTYEYGVTSNLINAVKDKKKELDTLKEVDIEKEFYKIPASTMVFLETASKVRYKLKREFASNNLCESELLKNNDDCLVPLSLIYSIFLVDGIDKKAIIKYFESCGFSYDKFNKLFGNISFSNIKNLEGNLESVKILYKDYITKGKNKDKDESDVSICNVLENVLDKEFTKSNVVDKVFELLNVDSQKFNNLSSVMELEVKRIEELEEEAYSKNFYQSLNINTRYFVDFTTKIYQLLEIKMKDGKHNTNILNCSDDMDTLALYIASHFYNSKVERFFKGNDVTYDKVMELLGIDISREEIDKIDVNTKIAVDKFTRFVSSGVNTNKKMDSITFEDVCRNLCNRKFNRSSIMENIFESLRSDIDLPEDFLNYMNSYFDSEDNIRKNNLEQEYFKDKDVEYYNYLSKVCGSLSQFKSKGLNKKYSENELIHFALLHALFRVKGDYKNILENIGLYRKNIDTYIDSDFDSYTRNKNYDGINIDLIIDKISPFIESLFDKDKVSYNVEDILKNIFNGNNSFNIIRMLDINNLSIEDFNDIDSIKKRIKDKKDKDLEDSNISKFFNGFYSNKNLKEILFTSNGYLELINNSDDEVLSKISDIDKLKLSIFLGYIDCGNFKDIFNKYNINISSILDLFNIKGNININNNRRDTYNNYHELLNNCSRDCKELFISLFKNNKFIEELFNSLDLSYIPFMVEVETGRDYEDTLTIEEKIEVMKSKPINKVGNDITDVATYGSDLVGYTTYINDSFNKMVPDQETSVATDRVKEVIKDVYTEEEVVIKEVGFLDRLFGVQPVKETRININTESLEDLQDLINSELLSLKDGLISTKQAEEYCKVLLKRIEGYRENVKNKLDELNSILSTLTDPLEILELKTIITGYESKLSNLNASYGLVYNYIVRSLLFMQNTIVTASGLQMSRDVLLPLLKLENDMASSISKERNSNEIIKGLHSLMSQVVEQNTDGIRLGLQTLNENNLSSESIKLIEANVGVLLEEINKQEQLKLSVNDLKPIEVSPKSDGIQLRLGTNETKF